MFWSDAVDRLCRAVVERAERAGWQPRKAKPVVRVCGDEVYDDRGNRVGSVHENFTQFGEDIGTVSGYANVPFGPPVIARGIGTSDAIEDVIAELSKWAVVEQEEKPKPRVRLEKCIPSKDNNYIGGHACGADGYVATWWLVCEDSDIRPETWGHHVDGGSRCDTHGSEEEAISAVVAELSAWAEVDRGEVVNG